MQERGEGETGARTGRRLPAGGAVHLASREDFSLGRASIRPSLRTVEGPSGSFVIEPRVMQVLVAFADANGAVLSRDDLMRSCWGGSIVSEDAVNRTVAEIRRIARQADAGFGIETIPRVGYRLEVEAAAMPVEVPATRPADPPLPAASPASAAANAPASGPASAEPVVTPRDPQVSRTPSRSRVTRRLVAGGLVAAAVAGTAAALRWQRPVRDPVFDGYISQGLQDLMMEYPGKGRQGVEPFSEAVRLRPDDARAWGLLALAHASESDYNVPGALAECEAAASNALKLDPREPHALVALAMARREQDPWIETERQLRAVLSRDRNHRFALTNLMFLTQASGYSRESMALNERILELDRSELRVTPGVLARQSLKLWIAGEHDAAQRIVEYAWNKAHHGHPLVWKALLLTYVFTGRYAAARQQVESEYGERDLKADGIALYLHALDTLENPTAANRGKLREGFLATDRSRYFLMMHGILLLSHLRELDAAYELYDGIVMSRGEQVVSPLAQDPQWRKTLWLFTPALRPFRADPRIRERTHALGLDAFWDARGIEPDEGRIYLWPDRGAAPEALPQKPART